MSVQYLLHHAEPMLRRRIIETLSAHFDAPVQLDRVEVSLWKGIEVSGFGLQIPVGGTVPGRAAYPLLAIQQFRFRTTLGGLLHEPTRIASVAVDGMEIHIPPPGTRPYAFRSQERAGLAETGAPEIKARLEMAVARLTCRNVRLFVESGRPGRDPLLFRISQLTITGLGRNRAMGYDAVLTNPKPTGTIHVTGHFGPWAEDSIGSIGPGQTPVDGAYSFENANLNTIRGLGGTLSSWGRFAGVLDQITIDGIADVPNFSLNISSRPVSLHTVFHAIVDGTNGDTVLAPVHGRLDASDFTTWGKVLKLKGAGHDIDLNVEVPQGRVQDFLRMAVKTSPPLMNGVLAMKARLHIPPGREPVPIRMQMAGNFHLAGVTFTSSRWQQRLNELSVRAQGHPEQAGQASQSRNPEARSQLAAEFTLEHGLLTASDLHYALPGAEILLNGVYSMDGRLFEFKGHVRTEAAASQMVAGWKGWLLKPIDRFLRGNGAGVELPIEISGTQGDLHFGLATHGADGTPGQIVTELAAKAQGKRREAQARDLSARAAVEDQRAAKATSVEDAQREHKAAVQDRAEAFRLLQEERTHD